MLGPQGYKKHKVNKHNNHSTVTHTYTHSHNGGGPHSYKIIVNINDMNTDIPSLPAIINCLGTRFRFTKKISSIVHYV